MKSLIATLGTSVIRAIAPPLNRLNAWVQAQVTGSPSETKPEQSEEQNRAILSALPDILTVVNADGVYQSISYNRFSGTALPLENTDVRGKCIADVLPPRAAAQKLAAVRRALATGALQLYEQEIPFGDRIQYEEVRIVPYREGLALCMVRDISDRRQTEQALQQSEAKQSALIRALPDLIMRINREGVYLDFFTTSQFQVLGDREALVGTRVDETLPPALAQRRMDAIRAALETGEIQVYEQDLWIDEQVQTEECRVVVCGPDEVLVIGRDVSDRKQAEAELRTQRNLLRAFLDNLPHIAWFKDAEGRFITINAAFGASCGCPTDAIVGKTDYDIWPQEMANTYRNDDLEVMGTGQQKRVEEPLVDADGNTHWIDTIKTPIYGTDGEILGTVGIATDVTERKQAESALRDSEARYRRMVETANEGIWIIDTNSRTSFVNPKMAEMLGYCVEEMMGRSMFDFMDEAGQAIALQSVELQQHGVHEQYDFKFQHKEGRDIWTIISTNPIFDDAGHYLGALGMITDISDRKQAELSLQRTNELLSAISKAQTQFITDADPGALFDNLLDTLLQLTGSEYGFIGEVLYDAQGQAYLDESYLKKRGKPYLKMNAITNVAWNEETQHPYEGSTVRGMEFHNLQTLFGQVIVTGEPVISNSPSTDSRRGGLPAGHPSLDAFLGIPFYRGEHLVGMVGIANRPGGYDTTTVTALEPFLTTCSSIIEAYRNNMRREQAEMALRLSQERLQTLVNALPFGVWVRDADDRLVLQNSVDLARYGNLLGTNLNDIPMMAEWKPQYYEIKEQYEVGEFFTYEMVEPVNREDRFFLRIAAPLPDTDGRKGMFGLAIDISDRKRTELALQQLNEELEQRVAQRTQDLIRSERDLRTIFNNVYDAILIHDLDGTVLDANDRALELRQATREQLIGAHIRDFSAPDVPIEQVPEFLRRVDAGETLRVEWRERRFSDQEIFDVEVSLRKGILSDRPVIIAGVREISDRKQAERALRESQQFIQTVLDTVPLPLFWKDRNSIFLGCNQQLATLMDLDSTADIIGKTGFEYSPHPEEVAAYLADDRQVMESGIAKLGIEETFTLPTGEQRWIETHKAPLRDWQGNVVGVVGMFRDITDRKQAEWDLQESRNMLELVLDTIPQRVFWKDRESRFLGCNATFAQNYRLTPEDIIGKTDLELPWAAWAHLYQADDAEVIHSRTPKLNYEEPSHNFEGEHIWIRTSKIPLTNSQGEVLGILGCYDDITDRKQAEQQLQAERLRLQLALEAAQMGTWESNLETGFWSERTEAIFGYAAGTFPGYFDAFRQLVHPDDQARVFAAMNHSLTTQTPCNVEYRIYRLDGELRWVAFSGKVVEAENGSGSRIVGVALDVTDRKQSEEALRDSEERLRLALTATNQGLYDLDLRTGDAIVSPEYAIMLGYDPATFQETNAYWIERLHPDDQESVALVYRAYIAGEIPDYKVEFRQRTQDGQWKWVLSLGKIVAWDPAGQPIRMLGTHTDIDDRKRLEQELRQINAELEQRVEERTHDLQQAIAAAEAANRAKSAFLANMSHELRTPLNAILGFAQLMSRDITLDTDKRQQLSIINRSGEHLLHLINDILEMSKIEAGRASFTPSSFDLNALLETLEALFQLRAREKGLQFRVERISTLPSYIETDENKLRQVLINLLGNAIKFTQTGAVILWVQANSGGGLHPLSTVRLTFEVEDTGAGIDRGELDSLFEPFTQSKHRPINQEGTGLGLPISRQFVQLMGGNLTVDTKPGMGSNFAFTIPVQVVDAAAVVSTVLARPIIGLAPEQPAYRILVVEDHETNRQLLVQLLQSVGFEVEAAMHGQEAIALWERWHPHLIWMDMRMPVMNGYEATQQIRQREAQGVQPPTVVIALTASAFEEDRARVLDVGCDDFVRKPFQEHSLLEKIAEHLGVQYLYAELEPAVPEGLALVQGLDAIAALQSLPAPLLGQLHQATIRLNNQQLYQLIEQIEAEQPALASFLLELANNFDLDQILALLQEAMDL